MEQALQALFNPSGLTPHGFCLLWEPGLIWLHALSDMAIGVAYFTIPIALITLVRKRRDIAFGWVFWLFAAFIIACGATHFLAVLTLWQPDYWLEGGVKVVTAIFSIATAIVVWPLIPRALALPSPAVLQSVNAELERRIADRDQAEAALRVSEARLRQSQKMEIVGQLTGGVAHDFNNLLTVILGSVETILRATEAPARPPDTERIARSGEMALSAVNRAAGLTQRLLAFARRQPLDPVPVNVNQLVTEMSDLLRRTLGETVTLVTVLDPDVWMVLADHNQLESVVLNLAVNARDAMPDGGALTIETLNTALDEAYVSQLTELIPAGDYVLLSVSDTGVGMDSKTVEHAFEPFFTTKPVGKGTGLGLSQVYGFVRQSQGYVRLYSEPGIGTTVKIFLPRLIGPSVAPSPQAKICEPAPARGEMILVVEDHEPLREHSSEILRELGYAVIEAPNGPAALALLDQFPQARLLFTDVVLPEGMNGRQLADEAMRRRPGLKVLYTTGYTRDVVLNAGQLGPDLDVLPKPFTYLELAAKLRSMLDGD